MCPTLHSTSHIRNEKISSVPSTGIAFLIRYPSHDSPFALALFLHRQWILSRLTLKNSEHTLYRSSVNFLRARDVPSIMRCIEKAALILMFRISGMIASHCDRHKPESQEELTGKNETNGAECLGIITKN
jgi:hypothetical protein